MWTWAFKELHPRVSHISTGMKSCCYLSSFSVTISWESLSDSQGQMPGSCPEATKIPGAPVRTALPYGFVSMVRLKQSTLALKAINMKWVVLRWFCGVAFILSSCSRIRMLPQAVKNKVRVYHLCWGIALVKCSYQVHVWTSEGEHWGVWSLHFNKERNMSCVHGAWLEQNKNTLKPMNTQIDFSWLRASAPGISSLVLIIWCVHPSNISYSRI